MTNKPKILSPVNSYDSLEAALEAKADAIYFGIENLNMRMSSNKFTIEDLKKIAKICQKKKVKAYLTLNSIIYDDDIKLMQALVNEAKKSQIDAIIAHDFATIKYVKKLKLKLHLSTQANISNIEAVKFYSQFADVIILARELSLKQIKEIINLIKKENITGPSQKLIEIETFVHGALCLATSGKCYMSLHQYNKSANRGTCLQACRRKYKVIEEETNKELLIDNKYIMSLKDLCTIAQLDKLIMTGINIFKIEGRARKADYVYTTTKCYKEAVKSFYNNSFTKEKIKKWLDELSSVYNRGFWHGGYYLNQQTDILTSIHGSQAKLKKTYIGIATNYFSKIQVAEFLLQSHKLKLNDEILIIGPTTGLVKSKVTSLYVDKKVDIAYKGAKVAVKLDKKIRKNDKLYILEKNEPGQL